MSILRLIDDWCGCSLSIISLRVFWLWNFIILSRGVGFGLSQKTRRWLRVFDRSQFACVSCGSAQLSSYFRLRRGEGKFSHILIDSLFLGENIGNLWLIDCALIAVTSVWLAILIGLPMDSSVSAGVLKRDVWISHETRKRLRSDSGGVMSDRFSN